MYPLICQPLPCTSGRTTLTSRCGSRDGRLGGGLSYELSYLSRVGQDWIAVPTKMRTKILARLLPNRTCDFRVRAKNSAGWGDYSETNELQTPCGRSKVGGTIDDGSTQQYRSNGRVLCLHVSTTHQSSQRSTRLFGRDRGLFARPIRHWHRDMTSNYCPFEGGCADYML